MASAVRGFRATLGYTKARNRQPTVHCSDGDSPKVYIDLEDCPIRMLGIDTPEIGYSDTANLLGKNQGGRPAYRHGHHFAPSSWSWPRRPTSSIRHSSTTWPGN
jgi:hypothetical protein